MQPEQGNSWPLGASCDEKGVNFALFSAHAESVELCLFNADGSREIGRFRVKDRTADIWHIYIPGLRPGALYGYRVHGPYDPEQGHRFNPNKLLIDPCARQLHGEFVDCPENYGYVADSMELDLSFDTRDNTLYVPKSVVVEELSNNERPAAPAVPLSQSIIYEAHVKGLTRQFPLLEGELTAGQRGTYAALGNQAVIDYLLDLGITAVELLPVHRFLDEGHLSPKGLTNYWGYNTLSWFAPSPRYALNDSIGEFRDMVDALHSAGLEVLLDVVYNHTAEGNELGPTICYRGIDNASYYRLLENRRYYVNDTGCGNTVNTGNPRVQQLVLDSLRYWAGSMNVDGFRFDLATVLGREQNGFDPQASFFNAVLQDPILNKTKLIAEPWDIGPGGYQLGAFPAGWSEWNDQYRDILRRYWKGEPGIRQALARAMHGSSDLFEWRGDGPQASINFVTSHDGFNLADLVSYNEKHNLENGEDNQDGHSDNHSINHGVEGPTSDLQILEARARHQRNLLSSLLVSHGVPMLLAGDEFGHSQQGNNNAYCQDNETTWLDWKRLNASTLHAFTKRLIELRKRIPVLSRQHYLHGELYSRNSGYKDITWYNRSGQEMSEHDWHNHDDNFLALLLPGDALFDDARPQRQAVELETGPDLMCILNNTADTISFSLPDMENSWVDELDTSKPLIPSCELEYNSLDCQPYSVRICTTASN